MINTKTLVIGAFLAVISALLQITPVIFSEMFVFVTVFSALPIYIISRISPKTGVLAYFSASLLIIMISTHEGLFFLCTNGIVGLLLGGCCHYTNKKILIWSISASSLAAALGVINYGIGIPVFGTSLPGTVIIQVLTLLFFSALYNIIYYYFSNFIYIKLLKTKII